MNLNISLCKKVRQHSKNEQTHQRTTLKLPALIPKTTGHQNNESVKMQLTEETRNLQAQTGIKINTYMLTYINKRWKGKIFAENFQLIYIERMIETENCSLSWCGCGPGKSWQWILVLSGNLVRNKIFWNTFSQNITNQLQEKCDFTVEKHDWQKPQVTTWRRYL